MRIHDVIKKAVLTEKALAKGNNNEYTFDVNIDAQKHVIKEAIETVFGVEVGRVRTSIRKGKIRRAGRRMRSKKLPDVKKAYVVVTKGSIDIIPTS